MSATVRRDGGRWHVAFTVEVDRVERTPARPQAVVGVDVGVKHLAVLSTGEIVPNPRHLETRPANAGVSPGACHGGRPGPAYRPAAVEPVGTRAQARSAGRTRGWRTCAATACTSSPPGWPASTARSWSKTSTWPACSATGAWPGASPTPGSARLRRQLAYKTAWNGGRLRRGRPLVSVLKTCSGCGTVKAKLALSERDLQLHRVRPGPRPGPQRRTQPRRARAPRSTPPGVARWQDVEPTVRPAPAGRWL